ncbi:MAG: radical SAM protein [Proteobacteria bacterium]|nr:radical SAM protein [Pseudomonadota bacterium]
MSGNKRFCRPAFESIHIGNEGNVFICQCPSFMKIPAVVGNIFDDGLVGALNSQKAREIRESIIDQSFKYCKKICPSIRPADNWGQQIIGSGTTIVEKPRQVFLEYDFSCNLKCFHCSQFHKLTDNQLGKAFGITDIVLNEMDNPQELYLVGGEVFFSKPMLEFLRNVAPERIDKTSIRFLTNGTLLNEKMWESLNNCSHRIDHVYVSIDAATAGTYKKIRRARFDSMLSNLDFLGKLRSSGVLKWFRLNYVVQKYNYREMGKMVDLGRAVNADEILFQALYARDSKEEELKSHIVHVEESEHFRDFLCTLFDPKLRDKMVVINDDLLCDKKTRYIHNRFIKGLNQEKGQISMQEINQIVNYMGFNEEQRRYIEDSIFAVEPWPLQTVERFRVLAWPDYNSSEELETLMKNIQQMSEYKDMCLCLRYDQSIDIEWNTAADNLNTAANTSGVYDQLSVLVINDEMKPHDWRRLGKSVNRVIGAKKAKNKYRATFLNVVCSAMDTEDTVCQ